MYHKVDGLVFDVGEGRPLEVLHHMGRDTEYAADLLDAEFAGGEELGILRRQRDGFIRHALFEDCNTMGVSGSAIGFDPVVTDLLGVL